MSKKTMRDIAIAILVVFVITIIVYPLIFSPDQKTPKVDAPISAPNPTPAPSDN